MIGGLILFAGSPRAYNMKIAALIPDRGDRPGFLKKCLDQLRRQTRKVDEIHIVGFPPSSEKADITERYRDGYQRISSRGEIDLIFFIENDDYYAPDYVERMIAEWIAAGKPDLFGTGYTIYYHIRERAFFRMTHPDRASAMNTVIRPGLQINWPQPHEVYTDLHLWSQDKCLDSAVYSKKTFSPDAPISIGIKHGIGLCGGRHHVDRLARYSMPGGRGNEKASGIADPEMEWLRANTDKDMFEFYKNYFNTEASNG